MRLSPVVQNDRCSSPAYPRRVIHTPPWLQRAVAVAAIALSSMGLLACGANHLEKEEIINPPGMIAEPFSNFLCSAEVMDALPSLSHTDVNGGELCGEDTAWADIDVEEPAVYRLSLVSGVDYASVAIIDPAGDQKAQLDVDCPSLDVEMTQGRWIVAVTAQDPIHAGYDLFELSLEQLP